MADQVIPLSALQNQSFTVSGTINGNTVTMQVDLRYNVMGQYWIASLFDQKGNPLVDSLPILTGDWPAANLLGQHGYLQDANGNSIGALYALNASGANQDYPGINSLGSDFIVIWGDHPNP